MSTTIKSTTRRAIAIERIGELVAFDVETKTGVEAFNVTRTDLLAALENAGILPAEPEPLAEWERELFLTGKQVVPADAVVILRETLPEVDAEELGYSGYVKIGAQQFSLLDVEAYDRLILELLALREYVTNPPTPPLDPAQVEALMLTMAPKAIFGDDSTAERYAERLYLAGVRIPEAAK